MKAISLLQPWADAVFFLGKNIENRSWKTDHRGPLAVHCAKGWDKEGHYFISQRFPDWTPNRARQMRGGIFGIMWVFDCLGFDPDHPNYSHPAIQKNPWAFGPSCWRLGTGPGPEGNGLPVAKVLEKPVMIGGKLGIWPIDDGILDLESILKKV